MNETKRGSGTTQSERYLAALCDRTFLDLWSYPNAYRDQGKVGKGGIGKELCDVLVVFDKHVIIFSEKTIEYPDTGDQTRDWHRWCKRAIVGSVRQVLGARRWVTEHPDRIFVDPNCNRQLPVAIPNRDQAQIHCIVVAQGARERCQKHFGGGNGSLLISGVPLTARRVQPLEVEDIPEFCTGDLCPNGPFVHILDEFNFDLLLSELDTITDFVAYLERKEKFVRSGHLINAAGEEELLAYYLKEIDNSGNHGFFPRRRNKRWKSNEYISIGEGHWTHLQNNPQYIARKKEDEISYLWDRLIGQFTKHILAETSQRFPTTVDGVRHEGGVRLMAMEPRVVRRLHSRFLHDAIENAPNDRPTMRAFFSKPGKLGSKTGYIFLQVPVNVSKFSGYDDYRELRRSLLYSYCMVMRAENPRLTHVVGIATEPPKFSVDQTTSEEMILIGSVEWTDEMQNEALEIKKELGIFNRKRMRMGQSSTKEWPDIPLARPASDLPNRIERRRREAIARRGRKKR